MTNREQALEWFRKRIKDIPMRGVQQMYAEAVKALEQPEIIRCKECYYHPACPHEQYLGLDGFCSHAERKEEADNEES